jgi:hypothetical protein
MNKPQSVKDAKTCESNRQLVGADSEVLLFPGGRAKLADFGWFEAEMILIQPFCIKSQCRAFPINLSVLP